MPTLNAELRAALKRVVDHRSMMSGPNITDGEAEELHGAGFIRQTLGGTWKATDKGFVEIYGAAIVHRRRQQAAVAAKLKAKAKATTK